MLVTRDDGALLLVERLGTAYADGKLCVPGGHLEQDESLVGAAAREVWEEVGVLVEHPDLQFVHVAHQRDSDRQERLIFFFKALRWSGEPYNREPERCNGLYWARPGELPPTAIDYVADAITLASEGQALSMYGW
ncbi:NUDIX domain-containing protein [Amycolatopsis sp. NPDC049868]|uniref:NUDIX domain-containing protein n=1 Tax=Amycolatopsis sp. NPDC049868 TaxID=3363934 RepID=UPI0037B412B7